MTKKVKITIEGTLYDISHEMFELLTKKSFKVPESPDWPMIQRVNGLIAKKLLRKVKGEYLRTTLGTKMFEMVSKRNKAKRLKDIKI